jgi:hypothetical protein
MPAIESAKHAVSLGDPTLLAAAIADLMVEAPADWDHLLLVHATPDPNTAGFEKTLTTHIEAIRQVLDKPIDMVNVTRLVRHLTALAYFHSQFQKTDEVFYKTAAWKDRDTAKLWRACAALQSQNRLLTKRLNEHATKGDVFDPIAANAGFLEHPVTGNKIDAVTQSDTGTELTELILRATLHGSVPSGSPDYKEVKSPYEDEDFSTMQAMAARFLFLKEAWQQLKFDRWLLTRVRVKDSEGEEKEVFGLRPRNRTEFLRRHVSYRRTNIFQVQEFVPTLMAERDAFTDTPGRLEQLAHSLEHPLVGERWNGKHNFRVLRNAAEYTHFTRAVQLFIELHHYDAWIDELSKARKLKGLAPWDQYLRVRATLNLLAKGFELASARLPDVDGHGCTRQVVCTSTETLTQVVANSSNLEEAAVRSVIGELTFSPKARGGMEWWDMPLVPLGGGDLLLVPTVAIVGNPARTVEHLVSAFTNQNSLRSRTFEAAATDHLPSVKDCRVAWSVKFDASDGKSVEFDVIAFWNGYVLLVEVKCLRSVSSPYEEYRAGLEINKAISQLKRRRALLSSDWDRLRKSAPVLNLPTDPVASDRVICIAVSNVMTFTGLVDEDVIVTDQFCFRRFFSRDPRIMGTDYSFGGGTKLREYGRIRQLDDPTPAELREYLRDPPQARWIRKQLRPTWFWLYPALDLQPMCQLSTEFVGERPSIGSPKR